MDAGEQMFPVVSQLGYLGLWGLGYHCQEPMDISMLRI